MQSAADLLSVASVATPNAASSNATSAADADAFARALADEMAAAGKAADRKSAAGDGRCGTSADTGASFPVVSDKPARPDRSAWHDLLNGVAGRGREPGRFGLGERLADLLGGIDATDGAGAKPDPNATGAVSTNPFKQAMAALRAAIDEALKDPSASTAAQGELPAAVQAALDTVLATAPPGAADRVAAFAGRLTERLSAMLAGQTAVATGTATAPEVNVQPDGKPTTGEAVLAALAETGKEAAPAIPVLPPKEAPSVASPAAGSTGTVTADGSKAASTANEAAVNAAVSTPVKDSLAASTAGDSLAVASTDPAFAEADIAGQPSVAPQTVTAQVETRAAAATTVRGSPETVAMLASTIARKLEGRTTHFDMELHPAEFGRVDVRLRIDAEGRVAAQMAFDNPVAAADLRARADELRRQLEQAGFQVASEDLTFTDRGGGGFDQNARNAFASFDSETRANASSKAFAEAERTARLAEDAGRLHARNLVGLDVRV